MDWPIKETLLENHDNDASGGRAFCGINSYNIGRPLLQMVHFVSLIKYSLNCLVANSYLLVVPLVVKIWIYLRMAERLGIEPGDKNSMIDMVIPTGAMGNLTGGYMAKQLGVPIGRLCAGVNINDITHRVIERGEFHRKRIQKTLSDAINIEVPYNFERIAFYTTGCNCALILEWMTVMERTQQLTLEKEWHERLKLDFCSARVTDDEMCEALRRVRARLNYIADPHTAVAMAAAMIIGYAFTEVSSAEEMMPVVILATASPCKFQEQMTVALGQDEWISWKEHHFPIRAHKTLQTREIEPYYFLQTEGAS
ncbi:hypothetical protein ACHAW5_006362 [Stephanodiscus triporus]|uniref:Threonine synthase n=1 Tax=Stephanodiscus triporus TaxID=2934178 RepID=A0ABD3MTX3_9STRA